MAMKYDKFNFFWAVVAEKTSSKVFQTKVPYLCAQIMNIKSAFSPATVVFEN